MLTLGLGQGASDYYGSLEHSINLDVGLYGKTKVICGVDRSGTEVFAKMQNFCDRIVTDQLSTPYKTENVSQGMYIHYLVIITIFFVFKVFKQLYVLYRKLVN